MNAIESDKDLQHSQYSVYTCEMWMSGWLHSNVFVQNPVLSKWTIYHNYCGKSGDRGVILQAEAFQTFML